MDTSNNNNNNITSNLVGKISQLSPSDLQKVADILDTTRDDKKRLARQATRSFTVVSGIGMPDSRKSTCTPRLPKALVSTKSKSPKRKTPRSLERMEHSKFGMYTGPIDLGSYDSTDQMIVVNLDRMTTLTTTGLGVVASEITFNPNTTLQWADYDGAWREYRVLAVEIRYEPSIKVNTTTVINPSVVMAMNKGPPFGTPTSRDQLIRMPHAHLANLHNHFNYTIRPDDYTDLDVGAVATPASEFSFLIYGNNASTSITCGDVWIRYVVQFSNRQ